MRFHEFGDPTAPTLMLIHGADTTWDRNFGEAIPTLATRFRVIAVATSGFDPGDTCDYESATVEAERIVAYVRERLGGELDGLYACSFGAVAAFYVALDRRIRVGGVVLDGLWSINTGVLTPLTARLEGPLARLLASGAIARIGGRLGLRRRDAGEWRSLVYTDASPRSFINTGYAVDAFIRDTTLVEPRADVRIACWFGSLERRRVLPTARRLRRVFPGIEVVQFRGLAHAELTRRPADLLARLVRFLGMHAAG